MFGTTIDPYEYFHILNLRNLWWHESSFHNCLDLNHQRCIVCHRIKLIRILYPSIFTSPHRQMHGLLLCISPNEDITLLRLNCPFLLLPKHPGCRLYILGFFILLDYQWLLIVADKTGGKRWYSRGTGESILSIHAWFGPFHVRKVICPE